MLELNIITPVSRPQMLRRMANDLSSLSRIRPVWYCVFDVGIPVAPLPPRSIHVGFWGSAHIPNNFGNNARNKILDMLQSGWVYFLDDDNTIHPEFEGAFLRALEKHPFADWFIFNQVRRDGSLYLPATDYPRVNHVDTGQCVVKREAIGEKRFNGEVYHADGLFYETLLGSVQPVVIPENVTYYNALRE